MAVGGEAAGQRLDSYAGNLDNLLAKYEFLPGALELNKDVIALLQHPDDAQLRADMRDLIVGPLLDFVELEIHGAPKCLDLVASRRLAFAAGESGATPILLRNGAENEPSAALTRWQAASAPSGAFSV